MANLYELSAEYAAFLDAYDNASCDEEAAEILQSLVDIHGGLEEKADSYARLIKNVEADAKAYKDESDRLDRKSMASRNLANRLKLAMLDAMRLTGQTEIKTSIGKWRVQMNPVSCEVVNIDAVPMEYHIRQEDKIDKKGLIDHYKATGELVDGVEFRQEQGIRFR